MDQQKILNSSKVFQELLSNEKMVDDCRMPCTFINSLFSPMEANDDGWIWLKFNKFVKAQCIY